MKGLDFALLEQNKAKAAATSNVEDDEALEQAFFGVDEGTSADLAETAPQPKKKSRQDLIRELKEKREQSKPAEDKATDTGIEEAKKAGKFKPIGFKPIGGDSEGKKRKKKEGGEKKKKKRRVEEAKDEPAEASGSTQPPAPPAPAAPSEKGKRPTLEPEPEPLDPDFDIFAGVEEYTGGIEDDEDEDEHPAAEGSQEPQPDPDQPRRGWFDKPKSPTPPPKEPTPPPAEEPSGTKDEEVEEETPVRLAPLASSVSVKDILAIDDAAAKEEKRKARKEKKKKKAELDAQGKVNRDYQK